MFVNQSPLFLNIELLVGLSCWVLLINLTKYITLKRNIILFGSIIFYLYFAGIQQFSLIAFIAILTFLAGKSQNSKLIIACIFLNLLAIVTSKWIVSQELPANSVMQSWIPLGVSFFVFEFIHYLVEVKRGMTPEESVFRFITFAFFFPTVVSGPIRRYPTFAENLRSLKRPNWSDIENGLASIGIGYIYKLMGDYCAVIQERSYNQGDFVGFDDGRILILCATLRIFLDFAGYSYIAIGFSRLIGIHLPRNFNAPYLATSIIEFWNRWHISLSSWVRDYLYIPMGGSRVAFSRQAINLIVSMVIIGLWHGYGSKFALWGALQGLALVVNHSFRRIRQKSRILLSTPLLLPPKMKKEMHKRGKTKPQVRLNRDLRVMISFFSWFLTMIFVSISWLVFFYPPSEAWRIIQSVFFQGVFN